jgi:uncharacterized protein YycO
MKPVGEFGDILLVNNPVPWWKPSGVFSALIRQKTGSNWSHVAILLDDGKLIEAMPSGVIIRDCSVYSEVPWRVRTWCEKLTEEEKTRGKEFLLNQLGKPYDWSIVFGFMSRNPLTSKNDKWFCSELARGFAGAVGRTMSDNTPDTLTPPSFFAEQEGLLRTSSWQGIRPLGWIDGVGAAA